MKSIQKFEIDRDDRNQMLTVPVGAILRHVHAQGEAIGLWFECDKMARQEERLQERFFAPVSTGWNIDKEAVYCGTAHFVESSRVFHVFEVTP